MTLSDQEIEDRIEKTVYKLEKYYKIYNLIYKVRKFSEKIKEKIFRRFMFYLTIYTILLFFIFRCL